MRLTRIFVPVSLHSGAEIWLPPSSAHHVSRVLRMRPGALLQIFNGEDGEYQAEVSSVAEGKVSVRVGESAPRIAASPLRLTLVQGISRGERMDWTLQKATELGVNRIVPVLTARSVVRLDNKQAGKKQEHWLSVVHNACEQCGRTDVPMIAPAMNLREYFATVSQSELRLVLSPAAEAALATLPGVQSSVELLIGPEGGLDDDELSHAQTAGFLPTRLGPRVLRTETASVVALTVLQALWGDLR